MQRVLFVTTFYPPFSFGGDAVDAQMVAAALARRGCEVTVVHDEDAYRALANGPPPSVPPDAGVEVIGLRSRLGRFGLLMAHQLGRPVVHHAALHALCASRQFDTVIFQNVSLVGGPGVFAICPGALHVFIAVEHWLICPTHVLWRYDDQPCDDKRCLRCTLHHRRPPQLWRSTGLLERAARHIDLFIARSDFSRRKHREYGFTAAMEVLPPFVMPPAARTVTRPHDRPYFLFVGRVEELKGLAGVLPLFARDRGADLVIAGTGGAEASLRKATAGVPFIRWLGHIPRHQLEPWYRHAVALIVPSVTYETFGIVVIEAFSHGTPVIVRRRGPLPELIQRAGGGVTFESPDDLDRALQLLLGQLDVRQRLAAEAAASFRDHFSEHAVMPRFLDLAARAARDLAASRVRAEAHP